MSDDPIRLREDPRAASALRRDLSLAVKFSAVPAGFDAAATLARFDAARAGMPAGSTGHALRARTARWWGVGAIGLATLIALGAWGARGLWTSLSAHAASDATSASPTTHANNDRRGLEPTSIATQSPGRLEPANAPVLAHASPHDTAITTPITTPSANPLTNPGALSSSPSAASAAPSRNGRRTVGAAVNPGDDLLARDARMLTDTYAALDVDPARALALANNGEREFPGSSHQDEREAIAVRALVALRRSGEARARGERFLSRSPTGPYAGAVRQALYEGPRDH